MSETTITAASWTQETIYRPDAWPAWVHMPPRLSGSDLSQLRQWGRSSDHGRVYTDAYTRELLREDGWQQVEAAAIPAIDAPTAEHIGRRQIECPACHGKKVLYALHRGQTTGLEVMMPTQRCICRGLWSFWRFWGDDEIVPSRFRNASLKTLAPSELTFLTPKRQGEIIANLKDQPSHSFHLYGEPGSGKTHMMSALYRHALNVWAQQEMRQGDCVQAVWRCRTTSLLQQHIAWDTRGDNNDGIDPPTVTVRGIQSAKKAGYRPALFLDELDKYKPSDYQIGRLAELVDEVYAHEGQVVATSNKDFDALCKRWGDDEAGTILRRIGAGPGAHSVKFAG